MEQMTEGIPQKERYEIAGLKVVMTLYYNRTRNQAKKYLAKSSWKEEEAEIEISLEHSFYEEMREQSAANLPMQSIEYIYTGELFHWLIIKKQGCMLHSSAVMVDDYVYLFSADSGTGKSTHTSLWKEHFGNRAVIVNDDKPVLRFTDDAWYVYGTPWSGKTDLNENVRGKLGAIVFLERSKENHIREIDVAEAIPLYMKQTIHQSGGVEQMDRILDNLEKILTSTPLYRMGCDMSDEAVVTAYEKIRRI
ncbi:MAG: hypothetical protein K6G64_08260 [Eubacterium sp.]|nr:hypothetical protein [Eubacterium sp.]